jgi:hypothetical protein
MSLHDIWCSKNQAAVRFENLLILKERKKIVADGRSKRARERRKRQEWSGGCLQLSAKYA